MRREDDPLLDLFRRRVETAKKVALASDGRIPARQVAQLARLARLVQITRSADTPPTSRRLWLAGLVAGTLVLVSTLLFARTGETKIQLDLELDEVSFVLSDRQVLTDVVRLSVLGVSGLEEITIPELADGAGGLARAKDASAVRIATLFNGAAAGEISLAPVSLPPKSRLTIERMREPYGYRLSLDGDDITLQVGVRGPVGITIDAPPVARDYATPRSFVLRGTDEPLDLDLLIKDTPTSVFLPQLEITELSFARVEQFADADLSLVRRVSTIRSGTLHLEDLNGRTVSLRPGEPLHFETARGQIRTLELREDHIALTFRGVARGMATGWGETRRSLMPTYFEALRERHGLYLFWGSTLYLLGIAVGVLRWWGVRL